MRKSYFPFGLWNMCLGLANPQYICLQIELQYLASALYSGESISFRPVMIFYNCFGFCSTYQGTRVKLRPLQENAEGLVILKMPGFYHSHYAIY